MVNMKLLFIAVAAMFLVQNRPAKLFIIGDSTVRNSNETYWGWGSILQEFLDSAKVKVDNQAMAGRSTRTFRKEGRWKKVLDELQAGDYVMIQFGHNEGSKPDTTRQGYRGVLRGIGKDSLVLTWPNKEKEVVYSYGEYLRRFVKEAKAKGAIPIILSMIPRNKWTAAGKIERADLDFGKWAKEIAREQQVDFIDLNELTASYYDMIGPNAVKQLYFPGDHTHTNYAGARYNAYSVLQGIEKLQNSLSQSVKSYEQK